MKLFVFAAVCVLMAGCTSPHLEEYTVTYTVIDRTHTASSTDLGITTNGNLAITGHSQAWELIIEDESGNISAVQVSTKDWHDYPVGTKYSQKRTKWVSD